MLCCPQVHKQQKGQGSLLCWKGGNEGGVNEGGGVGSRQRLTRCPTACHEDLPQTAFPLGASKWVSIDDHPRYRFLIQLDGHTCSWRMQVTLTMAVLTMAMVLTMATHTGDLLLAPHDSPRTAHALLPPYYRVAVSSGDQLCRPQAALVLLGVLLRRTTAPRALRAILGAECPRHTERAT